MKRRATLLLEDGRVFRGTGHGFEGEAVGEVVFNTSMTGYQEILTDPSYEGQIVTMTYPLIGNTGVNLEHVESRKPCPYHVVAYDFGFKSHTLRNLTHCVAKVTVVPANTSAEDVLALKPDEVFLSNGPGDPEPLEYAIKNVRALLGKKPVFGIFLGHQIMGLALRGKTYKLKFGHHGGNHPVLNIASKQVEITAQNHGFAVDPESLNLNDINVTHINLNDNTVEGMEHRSLPAFCVQYHPEASPGPHDSYYLFKKFFDLMKAQR